MNMVKSRSMVRTCAECFNHTCRLTCTAVRAVLHVAGPPCVDWSPQWAKRLRELGPNFLATIAWLAQRLVILEPVVVHENVIGFDVGILIAALDGHYAVFTASMCFSALGWPVKRLRRITICIRKDLLQSVTYPWDRYLSDCQRLCKSSRLEFARASQSDIDAFLEWARGRPTSMHQMTDKQIRKAIKAECKEWGGQWKVVLAAAQESIFTMSLLASECRRLVDYRNMARSSSPHGCEYLVCLLGQEPHTHPQFSTEPVMNTIIKSASIVWADKLGRPLTGYERTCAQGFVAFPDFSFNGVLSSSFLTNSDERKRSDLCTQAGNSMPVPLIGAAVLWSTLAVRRTEPIVLNSSLSKLMAFQSSVQFVVGALTPL